GAFTHSDIAVIRAGGEHNPAAAVENADAVDPLLERYGLHHLVGVFAMVGEHGVPGGAGDAVGELVGAQDHAVNQLPLLRLHVDEAGNRRDNDDNDSQGEDELLG